MIGTGIKGRVLRALGAEALSQVLNICVRLLLVPLFLSTWGVQDYGEWLILTAVAGWFGLGDLGGQVYFVNRMTAAWAGGRHEEFQQVLSSGIFLFLISACVLFGCVALALMLPQVIPWLGIKSVDPGVARLVLMIMALRLLVSLPIGLLLGVYRATGTQATSVMYANLTLTIQFCGSLFALLSGAGMLVLASIEVIPILVVAIIVFMDLRRRLPQDIKILTVGSINRNILREAISPSLHFLGLQFGAAIMIQGSVIAMGKALGPVDVAIFSSMRTVSNVVSRFLAMLSHSAWPEFTRLHSSQQMEKLTRLFKAILKISMVIGVFYLIFLRNFGELFYNWWLHQKLIYNPMAMYLMGCLVILTNLWTLGGNLLMATNQHEHYARWQLPVNVFALILCYFGAVGYGLTGAVLGLILGQSILMLGIIALLLKQKGWVANAACLSILGLGALVVFPLCLNLWSGLAAALIMTGLVVRDFGWRPFSVQKQVVR